MDLATFNALPAADAAASGRRCADIGSWVDDVVAGRPYRCRDALLLRAMRGRRRPGVRATIGGFV